MSRRKDKLGGDLDDELRVRIPRELKEAAMKKAGQLEYPSDLSAVVRVLLIRWVGGAHRRVGVLGDNGCKGKKVSPFCLFDTICK